MTDLLYGKVKILICNFFAFAGGLLAWIYGGLTVYMGVLVVLMCCDYALGVSRAIITRELSSNAGFKGLLKKCSILVVVGVGALLDNHLLNVNLFKDVVCCYYIANEAISVLENIALLGVPIPQRLKDILIQLKSKGELNDGTEQR